MEITIEQISEAIKTNPTLIDGIVPLVQEAEPIKNLITNKANLVYQEKFNEEIKNVHQKYDDQIFEKLGVRTGTKEDGSKQKTYELLDVALIELAELRTKKDSLTKDAKVIELEAKIESLKNDGGAKHVQSIFDSARQTWEKEKKDYLTQIQEAKNNNESFQKITEIQSAFTKLKFNPDTPESIRKMVIGNVEAELVKTSKIENGKLIFVDENGAPIIEQTTYAPKTAFEMISSLESIKDISLKEEKGGGGADKKITGSIQTTTVEGKGKTEKLILPEGSVKTKEQFVKVSEQAMLDSGITRRDPRWDTLKNQAYIELKVGEMPQK
jgi:hypothetical protein